MAQSQKDMTVASIVSLFLVRADFHLRLQRNRPAVKATICLVVGLAYTLGFATLAVGHLNILTITFVPMLIGLAIDYGVHLITRYEEELRHGRTRGGRDDQGDGFHRPGNFHRRADHGRGVSGDVFSPISRALRKWASFAAADCCSVSSPMMTLLPVLLLRGRQNVIDHQTTRTKPARASKTSGCNARCW